MSLPRKLERLLQPLAVPHLLPAILLGQVFFYLVDMLGIFDISRIEYSWSQVAAGEWWRALTFLLYPAGCHWILYALGVACTHFLGSVLEHEWGTLRFNLFLITGWLLSIAAGMIAPSVSLSNVFIAGSILLAFAYYQPNYVFHLYFIFPVQAKYLALLSLVGYTMAILSGDRWAQLSAAAALGNYVIFLGPSMWMDAKSGRRRLSWHAKQRAGRRETAAAGPRHRCVVCGKNSDTHPQEDFRYCSKCEGDQCYCEEHLRNHVHIVAAPPPDKAP